MTMKRMRNGNECEQQPNKDRVHDTDPNENVHNSILNLASDSFSVFLGSLLVRVLPIDTYIVWCFMPMRAHPCASIVVSLQPHQLTYIIHTYAPHQIIQHRIRTRNISAAGFLNGNVFALFGIRK